MRTFTIICLCIGLAATAKQGKHFNEDLDEFDNEFHIKYAGETAEEKAEREARLKDLEEKINKQNDARANGKATFSEKLYDFSDMSKEAFEKTHEGLIKDDTAMRSIKEMHFATGMFKPADRFSPSNLRRQAESMAKFQARMADRSVPDAFNAVDEGYVTSVKNQGSCGSCAAFAAHGMHEATLVKAGASSTNLDLSEQHLLDCAYGESGANGCNGATMQVYQNWFVNDGGLSPSETDYAYEGTSSDMVCDSSIEKYDPGYKMSSMDYTYSCDEDTMKSLVSEYGVVATALYASDSSFQSYAEGVYSGCSSTDENHAVLVVGYGTDDTDGDYWLVKNSWSEWWGDNGYIKVKRGSNECGIGQICVWGEATATGTDTSDDTTEEEEEETDDGSTCDISNLFWSGITGTYQLRVRTGGQTYISYVTCTNSICTPRVTVDNACEYICGSTTCG